MGTSVRLTAVLILAAILSPGVWERAQVRMTNLDLATQRLNQEAVAGDLILSTLVLRSHLQTLLRRRLPIG